jgi:ribosomal-protein-alanine N-acetyltransferase
MSQTNWRERVPVLRGTFVELREICAEDALTLPTYLADSGVKRYISPPPTTSTAFQGFVSWARRQRAAGANVCFAVIPHGTEHPVGVFQVRALTPDFATAEWGFALGAPFWGTGIFEDAARLVAAFAFKTLRVHRLEARAVTSNERGNGALIKLGAKGEAVLRGGLVTEGLRLDQFLWTLIASEFRAERGTRFCQVSTKRKIEEAVLDSQRRMFGAAQFYPEVDSRDCPFLVAGSRHRAQAMAFDFDNGQDDTRLPFTGRGLTRRPVSVFAERYQLGPIVDVVGTFAARRQAPT